MVMIQSTELINLGKQAYLFKNLSKINKNHVDKSTTKDINSCSGYSWLYALFLI